ncbi:WXG100 family type VII secretion target [Bacillus sp. FSL W7-1360]
MAGHIDAKPEELREQALKIQNLAEDIGRMISDYDGIIGFLGSSWKGASNSAYIEKYEERKPFLLNMQEETEGFSNMLKQYANNVEENDNTMASQIRG